MMSSAVDMSASETPRLAHTSPSKTRAVVAQIRLEAEGVFSLLLRMPDNSPLPKWEPGSHINLTLPNGITRQYSLCGAPADKSQYQVAILHEAASRGGSEYAHMFLRPGQLVTIEGPRNNFVLRPSRHYLFVAGGIGITPILPMIRQVNAAGHEWELHYGGRAAQSMAFLDELAQYGPRVHTYPQDQGRHLSDRLTELCQTAAPDTLIYCCGPRPMLRAVEDAAAHLAPGVLQLERFQPSTRPDSYVNASINVRCLRSGRTLAVPPERSILACLEEEGISVDASCREGVCGTCETRVLAGVPEHRDDILTGPDRDSTDRMYVCVSRATSNELVLDL
jgi:ferredoxin-NADP reductase